MPPLPPLFTLNYIEYSMLKNIFVYISRAVKQHDVDLSRRSLIQCLPIWSDKLCEHPSVLFPRHKSS
jgi:hypothetical protein